MSRAFRLTKLAPFLNERAASPKYIISKAFLHSPNQASKRRRLLGKDMHQANSLLSHPLTTQALNLGKAASIVLMTWKLLVCLSGTVSPIVVVVSGSMEPGFKRGDILFIQMNKSPIRVGEVILFNVEGKEIPIIHRVMQIRKGRAAGHIDVLTKGDNNPADDRHGVYAVGQQWLEPRSIIGKAIGYLPCVGWLTIIMTDFPAIKYLGILAIIISQAI